MILTGQSISENLDVACGNATISVIAEDEKSNTANDTYLVTVHENATPISTPVSTFNISGFKINDTDSNGTGIPNWTIDLSNDTGAQIASTTTGSTGFYIFSNLTNGTYSVSEVMEPNWTNMTPTSQTVSISGADVNDVNFTNVQTPTPPPPTAPPVLTTITVSPSTATLNVTETQLFTATALDQNNTPMSGINISWTISNSTIGSITPLFAVTGMDGNATTTFTASAAGTATVTATNGTVSGSSDVTVATVTPTLTPTPIVTLTPTPVSTYSITGTVFIDTNRDGVQDNGEQGYSGATVTLNTGQSVTTDAKGNYIFSNLPGGTHTVTQNTPRGYIGTTPNRVTITLNGDSTLNFGIAPTTTTSPMQPQNPNPRPTIPSPSPEQLFAIKQGVGYFCTILDQSGNEYLQGLGFLCKAGKISIPQPRLIDILGRNPFIVFSN